MSNHSQFLQASIYTGAGILLAGGARAAERAAKDEKSTEKIRIACVGVGGKGSSDTDHAGIFGEIVALCDIDAGHLGSKAKKFPGAKKFADYRKMLDEMGKDIDAVTVSTPDHTHAPAAIKAMKMGKHVYVQKPLTHSVAEARQMREVAKQQGVCTQMGNQGTAGDAFRTAVEIVQDGVLGDIKEVYVWTNRPVWPQSPKVTERLPEQPIPKEVSWDLFIGTAPMRPYNRGYHPFNWRGWWDFGTGALGDMACHTVNLPFMALKLGFPTSIYGESEKLNSETYPAWAKVTYEFPAREGLPAVKLVWHEGRKDGNLVLPDKELLQGANDGKFPGSGCLIVGSKGTLFSHDDYGNSNTLLGKDVKGYKHEKKRLHRHKHGHDEAMKFEWTEAIRTKNPKLAMSNFDYAGMLTESVLLGNVAIRVGGTKLAWDGPNLKFTDSEAANKLLSTEYRAGFTL
jgi:predicted dehydrogenase